MPFLIPNDNLCTLETTRLLELELRMRMYNGIGIVKTKWVSVVNNPGSQNSKAIS